MSRPRLTRCASGALAGATTATRSPGTSGGKDAYEVTGTVCQRDSALSPLRSEHDATSRASRAGSFGTTIFAEMSALAVEHGAINLGQGFRTPTARRLFSMRPRRPSTPAAISTPPGPGVPELLDAIALHQKRFYGLDVDARSEVPSPWERPRRSSRRSSRWCSPVTRWSPSSPYYDSYAASIALAGGVRRGAAALPGLVLRRRDPCARPSVTARAWCCSTPPQPDGKVFSRSEIDLICRFARERGAHGW